MWFNSRKQPHPARKRPLNVGILGGNLREVRLIHWCLFSQVILLYTMRRYFPRIHVIESQDGTSFDYKLRSEVCFPETDFIAVSAYRNKQVCYFNSTIPCEYWFLQAGRHATKGEKPLVFLIELPSSTKDE